MVARCFRFSRSSHRYRARSHIGRIPAFAVMRNREHVGLFLLCGNGSDDLERTRIDDADRFVEFGRDIQNVPLRVEDGAMWPNAMSEIHMTGNLLAWNIDHQHFFAVGAGPTHPRIAIDWHIGGSSIGRGRHFMSGRGVLRHGRYLLAGCRVDQADRVIFLIRNE